MPAEGHLKSHLRAIQVSILDADERFISVLCRLMCSALSSFGL